MKTNDLKAGQKKIEILVKVEDKNKERQVASQDGMIHRVCDAIVGDETGCIYLSLWDESIDLVQNGGCYRISNAYTSVYRGSLRLNTGKYGKITEAQGCFNVNTANNLSLKEII
ncbi:Single-stranded DNA binding protein Ssb [uncultured archaeon]|nr:Single-stranded DNA binding protein Ssb [uncultured archaeon]